MGGQGTVAVICRRVPESAVKATLMFVFSNTRSSNKQENLYFLFALSHVPFLFYRYLVKAVVLPVVKMHPCNVVKSMSYVSFPFPGTNKEGNSGLIFAAENLDLILTKVKFAADILVKSSLFNM